MITLLRIIKSGFQNFYRNSTLTIASVLIITITLLVGSSFYFGAHIVSATSKQIEKKVDISVYLKTNAKEEKIIKLKEDLEKLPELKNGKVVYESKEDVKKEFESRHQKSETIEALKVIDTNPFGGVLNISTENVDSYKKINDYIYSKDVINKYDDVVESTSYKNVEGAINKLQMLIKFFTKTGIILSIILAVIAFLVTFNTMRLVMHSKREEIEVMKLVGASNFFAKAPLVFSGMLYGFTAGLITIALNTIVIKKTSSFLNEAFVFNLTQFYSDNFLMISLSVIVSGIMIGFASSYIAVIKYMKI